MKSIFLVEDDAEIARNLTRLLCAEGFTVTCAQTQREAVSLLSGNKFDLALVDISLPDGNGFSVCTEIRQAQDFSLNPYTSAPAVSLHSGLFC